MKKYRFFGPFLNRQEKWLNRMDERGWRLTKTSKVAYWFEKSEPKSHQYRVNFVGDKPRVENQRYRDFLEELGYSVHIKPINLNYSFGKARFRPWALGGGKISTSPGTYNKELFIIEKLNDGKPFELYTNKSDLCAYYRQLRKMYVFTWLLIVALFIGGLFTDFLSWGLAILAVAAVILLFPVLGYSWAILSAEKDTQIEG